MKKEEKEKIQKKGFFSKAGGYLKNQSTAIFSKNEILKGKDVIQGLYQEVRKESSGRNEKFFDAVSRMNLTPESIIQNYKFFRMSCFINLACVAITIILIFYFLFAGGFFGIVAGLGAMAIFLTSAATFSFRAFQIRKMKLYSFKEWFERKDYWFPKPLDEKSWMVYWDKLYRNKKLKGLVLVK